jgi:hypothetical protein
MSLSKIIRTGIALLIIFVTARVLGGVIGGLSGPSCGTHNAEWQLVTNGRGTYSRNYAVNTEWCLFMRSMFFPAEERLFVPPGKK